MERREHRAQDNSRERVMLKNAENVENVSNTIHIKISEHHDWHTSAIAVSAINHDWTRNFLVMVAIVKLTIASRYVHVEMLGYRAFDQTGVKLKHDFDKINL